MVVLIPTASVTVALSTLSARAAQDDPVLWYLTRTTAVAAYVALTLSVMLGMLRAIARTSGERLSWVVDELHSFIASLAGGLIAGHLLSLKFDTFIPFTWNNLLIPGDQPYLPLATNLGVFAFYTMTVVLVSSWFRALIPYHFWRSCMSSASSPSGWSQRMGCSPGATPASRGSARSMGWRLARRAS